MTAARTLTFLGTGTSVGVPAIGCDCPVCKSDHPRNNRTRSSVLVGLAGGRNVIIDTGPEMRIQLVREDVKLVHAVLYTHFHADHLFGLDDLRLFPKRLGHSLPIYCNGETEEIIRQAFSYAFHPKVGDLPEGAVPRMEFERVTAGEPFEVLGERVVPVPLVHARFNCLGYRFGDLAYCTDVSRFPEESLEMLAGVKTFIVDALRFGDNPHPAHQTVESALGVIERLRPERAFFTHMGHELDYQTVNPTLPENVEMAYDGLKIEF